MRAIGLGSITLATLALTATDVRGANNNWCATYTKPENENCTFATFEQCQATVWGVADGVGPIRSPIRRSGPVGAGPSHRASRAAAVSAARRGMKRPRWPNEDWGEARPALHRHLKEVPQPRSSDSAGENALLDDGVNAPVSVDNLRNAEIDRNRYQRDCLVFGQALGVHQERSHFAECILEREIDR